MFAGKFSVESKISARPTSPKVRESKKLDWKVLFTFFHLCTFHTFLSSRFTSAQNDVWYCLDFSVRIQNKSQLVTFYAQTCCRGHNQVRASPALKWFGQRSMEQRALGESTFCPPAGVWCSSSMPCPEWLALTTMPSSEKVREFLRKSKRRRKNVSLSSGAGEEIGNWNLQVLCCHLARLPGGQEKFGKQKEWEAIMWLPGGKPSFANTSNLERDFLL